MAKFHINVWLVLALGVLSGCIPGANLPLSGTGSDSDAGQNPTLTGDVTLGSGKPVSSKSDDAVSVPSQPPFVCSLSNFDPAPNASGLSAQQVARLSSDSGWQRLVCNFASAYLNAQAMGLQYPVAPDPLSYLAANP